MFLFSKNKELLARLEEYLSLASNSINLFSEAFSHVLKKGINEHFEILARRVHQEESNADDVRRQIELDLYEKSLMPESREDLLEIIEILDRVPNRAESILNMFITQKTKILPEIKKDMKELVKLSLETFAYSIDATRDCFGKMEKIKEFNRLIDNNESIGDRLERKMIQKIFAAKLDPGDKLIQKEFVLELGAICDLCERVKDRLVICSVKRNV